MIHLYSMCVAFVLGGDYKTLRGARLFIRGMSVLFGVSLCLSPG